MTALTVENTLRTDAEDKPLAKRTPQPPLKLALQKGRGVMRKFNAENERSKRRYVNYLRDAKGHDEASLDKVRAALVKFEESTKFKPFKSFHSRVGSFRRPPVLTGRPRKRPELGRLALLKACASVVANKRQ